MANEKIKKGRKMKFVKLLCVSVICGQILLNSGVAIADTVPAEQPVENSSSPSTSTSEAPILETSETSGTSSGSLENAPISSTSSASATEETTTLAAPSESLTTPSIQSAPKTTAPAPKSIISSVWGTCPVTFDDTTGVLTVSAGNLNNTSTPYMDNNNLILTTAVTEVIFEPGVVAPADSSGLFGDAYAMSALTTIQGSLDTSNVTDMENIFQGCQALTSVDLSGWDTSNVTNMSGMFWGSSVVDPQITNWNTSKVTDMHGMFNSATAIQSLDLSNWDTSNVTDMSAMFTSTAQLSSLNISNWDTSNVTNMAYMFNATAQLSSLNISNWNTSKVTDMQGMFQGTNIDRLDLGKWNTSNVINMYSLFGGASSSYINLSNWDTSKAVRKDYVFWICLKLSTLILGANTKFDSTATLPAIDTTSGQYSGGWERVSPTTPSSVYQSSDLFMTNYDGSAPGTYVWQTTKAAVVAKDSTLHVGDAWNAEDNFVSATDAFGNPLSFSAVTVTGTVDTSKAGVYPITYTNGSVSQTINVTVLDKADLSTIKAKDSTLHVGDTWKAEDNFISATDPSGNPLSFSAVTVTGTVDTSKAGVYPITYTNGSVSQTINVTVLDKADLSTIKAKDSTLHVGDTWKAEDNFISATDPSGNPLSFSDVTVTGTVDTSKAGVYPITYTNGSVSQTINVTVLDKADLSTIKAKDSTLHVGDTWKAEDNFISATDPSGNPLSFSAVTVTGTVDTSKAGVYPITYTNGSVSQTINITVLDKATTPSSNSKPSNTTTSISEKVENKELPKAGESNSNWFISIFGMILVVFLGFISAFSYKKKN